MESTTHLNSNSGNEELMAYYRAECRNANGEAVGTESDTPEAAAEREGWTVLRFWEHEDHAAIIAAVINHLD